MALRARTLAAAALLLAVTACAGSDDDDGAEDGDGGDRSRQAFVDAGADSLDFDDEVQAQCISAAVIDGIGFDAIEATGLTPEEFGEADSLADTGVTVDDGMASRMQTGVVACGDLVATFAAASDASDEERECARLNLDDELMAGILVMQLLDLQPTEEMLAARTAAQECIDG